MLYMRNTRCYVTFGLMLAMLSWIMMLGVAQAAGPKDTGPDHDKFMDSRHQNDRSNPAGGDHIGNLPSGHQGAEVPRVKGSTPDQHKFMDSRYHHDRSYPMRGRHVARLPNDHSVVTHHNTRYYFHGGVWYRPEGRRFVIIAPPIGMIVPFLPFYYSTIWLGGIPYYYANDVYYAQTEGGYKVVEPPKGETSQEPATSDQLFIYPRNGQNEQQQANDRYECHRWAVSQTGYDPTQPAGNIPEAQITQKRADYQRAMGACLEGRGYTVK